MKGVKSGRDGQDGLYGRTRTDTGTKKFKSEKVKGKGAESPAAMLFNSQPRTVMPHYTFDYGSQPQIAQI